MNRIESLAKALFAAKLREQSKRFARTITDIKSECNARGILASSITVRQIMQQLDGNIRILSETAVQCSITAFESSGAPLEDRIQNDLLDSYAMNLSEGCKQLESIAKSESAAILNSLTNSEFALWLDLPQLLQDCRIEAESKLRKYYADSVVVRKPRSTWWKKLAASGLVLLVKGCLHFH